MFVGWVVTIGIVWQGKGIEEIKWNKVNRQTTELVIKTHCTRILYQLMKKSESKILAI